MKRFFRRFVVLWEVIKLIRKFRRWRRQQRRQAGERHYDYEVKRDV